MVLNQGYFFELSLTFIELIDTLELSSYIYYLSYSRSTNDNLKFYHLSKLNCSISIVSRLRYIAKTIARPTAASAAATVITNTVNT